MKPLKDGGSAFPVTQQLMNSGFPDTIVRETSGGMSLRDYFAAKAMQGMMSYDSCRLDKVTASHAYSMADAMLKAREVSQ